MTWSVVERGTEKKMKKLSTLFAVACIIATPCWADDAQDAVELLALSIKCPNRPFKNEDGTHLAINNFTGSKSVFQMEWEQVGQGKSSYSAKFKDLNRVDIEASAHPGAKPGDTLIRYSCSIGSKCVDTNFGFPVFFIPPGHYMFPGFSHEVCSREVAEDIKVAVETLIKWNASGAPPAEPQKPAPRADRPEASTNRIIPAPLANHDFDLQPFDLNPKPKAKKQDKPNKDFDLKPLIDLK
jgi:hypothetical protein